jgi:signal transduction histidine kinase
MPGKKPAIFLSHTGEDKPFARRLGADLDRSGARVWIDEAEIQIGDSLIRKIEEGISNANYLGVVLSPASVASSWVQREVEIALTKEIGGKRVIVLPFLYKTCDIPPFLSGKTYADFRTNGAYYEELNKVKKRLGLRLTDISHSEVPQVNEDEIRSVMYLMHNLRSSLTGIRGSAEMLLAQGERVDFRLQRKVLEDIVSFSEEAHFQERQYRVMRTFQDGTYGLHLERVDLTPFLRKVARPFLPHIKHKNLHLLFQDKGYGDNSIICDCELMDVCFGNLLQNAINYSHNNREILVSLNGNRGPEILDITISNYGIPVNETEVESIFKMGYRSKHAVQKHVMGVGFGLYLALMVARAHGGDIVYRRGSVESHTIFEIILPRRVFGT